MATPITSPVTEDSASTFFAETFTISYLRLVWTFTRVAYVMLIAENPLIWSTLHGRKNPQADVEGVFLIAVGLITIILMTNV